MDEEYGDNFYVDDAAQGAEGNFFGYDFDQPQNNFGQGQQEPMTDYNYFDFNSSFGNGLQGLFGTGNDSFLGNTGQMPNFGGVDFSSNQLPQGNIPIQETSYGDMFSKILGGLGNLFNPQNQKKTSSVLGALLEGYQNKQNANLNRNTIQQVQQQTDPFSSQRPYYQQQLQSAVSNPYQQPIVQDQINALKHAQDIKNAAAGRRSNSATTDPELLKAMADIAMRYQQSLHNPAGVNIAPNTAGLSGLLDANKYDTRGFVSPLMSALGFNVNENELQNQKDQALANFIKVMSTMNKGQ
jgi:hypothetical protein